LQQELPSIPADLGKYRPSVCIRPEGDYETGLSHSPATVIRWRYQ
jgi:hypothetical protein